MIPLLLGKDKVKELMRKKFKSCVFAPDDFCSDVKLDTMTSMYVPFWMYDYRAKRLFLTALADSPHLGIGRTGIYRNQNLPHCQ